MDYINEITLELNTLSAPVIIGAKQYDEDSRGIKVSYTKNGEQYLINENNIVRLRMRKPDGTSILNDAQVNTDGTVTVIFSYQCLSAAGRAYADLMEFDMQGKLLSTASFVLDIQAAPNISGHNALSSDEFQSLIGFIDQGDQVIGNAQKWANGHQGSTLIPESSSIDQPGSNNNAKYWSEESDRIGHEWANVSNMWANGQTTGTPAATNNSKYWSEQSNMWANGQTTGTPGSNNNAKYWAQEADYRGEQWAEGTRNGQPVSEYSNKSAKYYSQEAKRRIADTIDNMYFNLNIDTGILTAIFTDLDT